MSSKRELPFLSGTYTVGPGLSLLKNAPTLIIDEEYERYQQEKVRARDEDIDKYYQRLSLRDDELMPAIRLLARLCASEYPAYFRLTEKQEILRLECLLSDEILTFDGAYFDRYNSSLLYDYKDGFDAVVAQLQEDVALWRLKDNGEEFLTLIHLSFPNHWSPQEKIGKSFNEVHAPVGEWERELAPKANQLVKSMIEKGPFVRFAWGLATDDRLNHHPQAPATSDPLHWKGRRFDPANPQLFVRVERQVLHPLPEARLSAFFIRTFFYDVKQLDLVEREALAKSLASMTSESLLYKGLAHDRAAIIDYLAFLNK